MQFSKAVFLAWIGEPVYNVVYFVVMGAVVVILSVMAVWGVKAYWAVLVWSWGCW